MTVDTSLSLLDRLIKGEEQRDWDQFVGIYRSFISNQIEKCGIEKNDAEDLAQESLTTIFTALPKFRHNGNRGAFRKWLKSIVVQRISRYYRRHQRKPVLVGTNVTEQVIDGNWQMALDRHWESEHDQYVLGRLMEIVRLEFTQSTWFAFEQQVLENRAPHDVASDLETTVNAVLIAKSRVLRRLRSLGEQMIDE